MAYAIAIAIVGMILLSVVYKRNSRLHIWPPKDWDRRALEIRDSLRPKTDSHQQYMREVREAMEANTNI